MARKPPPRKKAPAGKQSSAGLNKGVVLMIIAALVPFSLPTVTVLSLTMLPTAAAYFSERGPHRYAWLCVGGFNFSGVIPFLFGLWFGVHTMDEALRLLSDASVLFWAYTTSAFGWMVYKATPPVVSSWLQFSSQRRIAALKGVQKKLVDEWGDDVGKKGG